MITTTHPPLHLLQKVQPAATSSHRRQAKSMREALAATICASLPAIKALSFSASVRGRPCANWACSASKSISERLTKALGSLAGAMW